MAPSWCIRMEPLVTIILYIFCIVYSTYYVSSMETNESVKLANKTVKVQQKMYKNLNSKYPFKMWNENGEKYSEVTIPVKRKTEEDISRTAWIERFKMKYNHFSNREGHEYAHGRSAYGSWTSSKASLGIWNPYVEGSSEFSLTQLWVIGGARINQVNSIEVGWHVYPRIYNGDNRTRFFIYWTNNSYQPGYGCYNLECPGFVRTSDALIPGDVLEDISVYGGARHDLTLSVEWREDRNWWLFWHTDQDLHQLGYWPGSMFPHLNGPAEVLDFGGEIYNSRRRGRHTKTQMGSGYFATAGLTRAAYVSYIEMNGQIPYNINYHASDSNCYSYVYFPGVSQLGRAFFFGGPGYGAQCR